MISWTFIPVYLYVGITIAMAVRFSHLTSFEWKRYLGNGAERNETMVLFVIFWPLYIPIRIFLSLFYNNLDDLKSKRSHLDSIPDYEKIITDLDEQVRGQEKIILGLEEELKNARIENLKKGEY